MPPESHRDRRIATQLIAQLHAIARRFKPPRIARLHVPAALCGAQGRSRDAEFCAIELEDGAFGLSYVLLGQTLEDLTRAHGGGEPLAGVPALALAGRFASPDLTERALALASINALTASVWRQIGYVPAAAANSLGDLRLGTDDHLGMIGFFPPLVRQVQACGARLTVVELDQAMVERQGRRFPEVFVTFERAALGRCNKVVGTSTMLLNDTLDDMLAAAPRADSFAVIGPSAGLWPDALFERGVTLLGGTLVTDGEQFRAAMSTGTSWGAAAQKFALSRADWPGWETLLR